MAMGLKLLDVKGTADYLGVSRRRVSELILRGALPAERIGQQFLITFDSVQSFEHNRQVEPGRPLSQDAAWRSIRLLDRGVVQPHARDLDSRRRRLRSRAKHIDGYVHPSLIERVRNDARVVLGGRDAAFAFGVPADPTEKIDLYIHQSNLLEFCTEYSVREQSNTSNLKIHVVEDRAWPFPEGTRISSLWTSWLDLADARDRAESTVLDRLAGRPINA
jgi:excisionase family DNA binding protein